MLRQLGKYKLIEHIALGGMAEIFLARQEGPAGFEKELIVKCILPQYAKDMQFIGMFLDEARLAARLSHPNIAQIFELGEENGTYFIAMEYVRGVTLNDLLERVKIIEGQIPYHYAARIVASICDGLDYAHEFADEQGAKLGLVHRDVSPDNVLLSYNGAVKMIDFGVAKATTNENRTDAGVVKGKYLYMSPEQIRGESLDGRSDVFSVSVVLFELVTGTRPFGSDTGLAMVSKVLNNEPTPPTDVVPSLPQEMENIILRGLEKDRDQRYSSARYLQRDLEHAIQTQAKYVGGSELGEFVRRVVRAEEEDLAWLESKLVEVQATRDHRRRRAEMSRHLTKEMAAAQAVPTGRLASESLRNAGRLGGVGVATGHLAHMAPRPTVSENAMAAVPLMESGRPPTRVIALAAMGLVAVIVLLAFLFTGGEEAPPQRGEHVSRLAKRPAEASVKAPVAKEAAKSAAASQADNATGTQVPAAKAAEDKGAASDGLRPKGAEPEEVKVEANLPRTGRVNLTTNHEKARVLIDGDPRGSLPLGVDLALGTHRVEVVAAGKRWKREVIVQEGVVIHLVATFPVGYLQIHPADPGLRCSVDGRDVIDLEKSSFRLTLLAGEHHVKCVDLMHVEHEQKVEIRTDETSIFKGGR
jgi:hypothetical protein